jgi:hypothetical protein
MQPLKGELPHKKWYFKPDCGFVEGALMIQLGTQSAKVTVYPTMFSEYM